MGNEFVYSLRLAICPDFHPEEKFADVIEFCKKANINDVQFFVNMEEINQGHLTLEETKVWLDMIGKFKPQLEAEGITVSLNPWTTILHGDRGRALKEGQNFRMMVDLNGRHAEATPCPLDENFQKYLREIYGAYAELGFNVIWLEDDCRLHNHYPLEWGGCFCEAHRKEFSRRIGKDVTIEEFVEGVLKEGEPHPYRKVWLDTARDTMNAFTKVLGDAVHEIAPDTRVALMSSAPQSHCVEGRDWQQIFTNISGKNRPLNRPHLPSYSEVTARSFALNFQRYTRLSAAMTKGQVEFWPELECFPFTTFMKSHKFTSFEIECTLAICAEGITLNIFDMMGNGINKELENEKILAPIKAYMNGVKKLHTKAAEEQGVCVLYSPKSSYTLHTDGRKTLSALQPCETFWAEYFSAFGIAVRYTDDYTVKGRIVAVSGQYFRNLTPEEIKELFANNVMILEADAVDTLLDMGLGSLAGVASGEWYAANQGRHSYEQAVAGSHYQNLPEMRMSAQGTADYLNLTYIDEDIRTLSEIKKANGETVGKGVTCGNQVIILPYGHMRALDEYLLHPAKKEMFMALISEAESVSTPVMVRKYPFMTVNEFAQEDRRVLLLTNFTSDDVEELTLQISGEIKEVYEVSREDGSLVPVNYERDGELLMLPGVSHMKTRCFVVK